MNGALIQDLLAGLLVAGAAGFLVWRRVRRRATPAAMCGDCPGCAPGIGAPKGTARIEERGAAIDV